MRIFISVLVSLLFLQTVSAFANNNDYLIKLDSALTNKPFYDAFKLKRIDSLKGKADEQSINLAEKYRLYQLLYNEYKTFNYHEAYAYIEKLKFTAIDLGDAQKTNYIRVELGFILLSSGLFKEALDSLKAVDIRYLSKEQQKEYYSLTARTYYDLADFDLGTSFAAYYNQQASHYIDSTLSISAINSFEHIYYRGLRELKNNHIAPVIASFIHLLNYPSLTYHQYAITASTLSDIYIRNKQIDKAIGLLAQAATADIKSSTKEAAAMLILAQLLHTEGDDEHAYTYIKQANDDALYYGARQRKLQVSAILPVIAGERINNEQHRRKASFIFSAFLTSLLLVIILFSIVVYKQLQKIKCTDKILTETNNHLTATIAKLNEAEKIKEEYIGYYLDVISDYMNRLEKFKVSVDQRLITKKFDDIKLLVHTIDLKKEREELFSNFDNAFLKLFPSFINDFNALFPPGQAIKANPKGPLSTDLRLFALIRLGIKDTHKIARILEYSVNTIYNYRTRIKNKSYDPDRFEEAIMSIHAVQSKGTN